MRLAKTGFIYFAIVFGTGFILGTIRVLWLIPKVGVRTAELLEMPIMISATILAAGWINRRYLAGEGPLTRLGTGCLSLVMLTAAELGPGVLQGRTVIDIITNRDPVSGAAYYASLILFALMPWLLNRLSMKR